MDINDVRGVLPLVAARARLDHCIGSLEHALDGGQYMGGASPESDALVARLVDLQSLEGASLCVEALRIRDDYWDWLEPDAAEGFLDRWERRRLRGALYRVGQARFPFLPMARPWGAALASIFDEGGLVAVDEWGSRLTDVRALHATLRGSVAKVCPELERQGLFDLVGVLDEAVSVIGALGTQVLSCVCQRS